MESRSRRSFLKVAGASIGALAVARPSIAAAQGNTPTTADIGFCKDMTTHHVQALAMCQRVLGTDTGGSVQAAASEVLQNQAIEVGTMRAWLADWGESTKTPELAMGWMGMHGGEGMATAMMPGLATPAQLQELSQASGKPKGRMWLQLMQTHHESGVDMATAAISKASSEKVIRLATQQVQTQSFEIAQYNQLLGTQYASD